MRHSCTIRLLTAGAGTFLATAVMAHGGHNPRDYHPVDGAWKASAVHQLASMSGIDAMVTAAALDQVGAAPSARSRTLLDRAVRNAPEAADISLLDTTVCSMQTRCDVLRREQHLRQIDPTNGIAWMASLHVAAQAHEKQRIDLILAKMAKTTAFNLHFVSLGRRFMKALADVATVGLPADKSDHSLSAGRYLLTSNMLMALTMPNFQDLLAACKPHTAAFAARRDNCRKVAQSLQRGDSLISNLTGLRIAQWTASDASTKADFERRRRQISWRVSRLGAMAGDDPAAEAKQAAGMFVHDREIDNINAMLTDAGEPLDPPRSWQPLPQQTHSRHSP